jgi:hypothetical protein
LAADIDALGCWLLVIPTSLLTDLSGVGAAGHIGTGGLANARASVPWQPVIEKILTHLGLQARATPRSPARGQALQAA